MGASFVASDVFMDTSVTIELVHSKSERGTAADLVDRAFAWFRTVEAVCSRFEPASELSQLSSCVGKPVTVTPVLFQALDFALAVAEMTDGVFDPTIGRSMELAGYDRNYRSGQAVGLHEGVSASASFRDVRLDRDEQTVTLLRPLVLDLGAVAKGFAIDLAATELSVMPNFAIEAGGDVFAGGCAPDGGPWHIGIRHPRSPGALVATLSISEAAVCTSGDYERPRPDGVAGGHIITSGKEIGPKIVSSTVIAPTAMSADALSTAAYALGPVRGIELLETQGVGGFLVSDEIRVWRTQGMWRYQN
jgi:FAD:protein FMN transferase